MCKVFISLLDLLDSRMKAIIPQSQRNKIIVSLLVAEIVRHENALHECALAIENDETLKTDMGLWDVTINDGIRSLGL